MFSHFNTSFSILGNDNNPILIFLNIKMRAKSYSVFVFFWFTALVFSQNKLSGTITTETKKNLEGCHVHIGNKTVNTNKKGFYEIKDLPSGTLKVSLS